MSLIEPQVSDPELAEDDPIFTHIVKGKDGKSGETLVMEARVFGTPVEALCGHVWVPSRDPQRHPVCERCIDIFNSVRNRGAN